MTAYIYVSLILFLSINSIQAQENSLIDPYMNWTLGRYYSPQKVDFSLDYLNLRSAYWKNAENILTDMSNYNCSALWRTEYFDYGVLGANYRQILIRISNVSKDKHEPMRYLVTGKSKVGPVIRNFEGDITIIRAFLSTDTLIDGHYRGSIFAEYRFYEDSTKKYTGIFKGLLESLVCIDSMGNVIHADSTDVESDGWWNNSYVGIWRDYDNSNSKKCIWGNGKLPFTFDFDKGEGELEVNEKYVRNGWEKTNAGKDWYLDKREGKAKPVDVWW